MFRLNGDIIRQLNSIYSISFNKKYKKEIKERIFLYINSLFLEYTFSIASIKQIEPLIAFKNNEPYKLSKLFFKQHKEALFNSFNPIWFNLVEKKGTLSCFFEDSFNEIKLKFLEEKNLLNININIDKFIEKELKSLTFCFKVKNQSLNDKNIINLLYFLSEKVEDKSFLSSSYHASDRHYFLNNDNFNKSFIGLTVFLTDSILRTSYFWFPVSFKEKEYLLFKNKPYSDDIKTINVLKKSSFVSLLKEQLRFFIYQEFLLILNKYIADKKIDLNFNRDDLPF